jgi:hypothetical protein
MRGRARGGAFGGRAVEGGDRSEDGHDADRGRRTRSARFARRLDEREQRSEGALDQLRKGNGEPAEREQRHRYDDEEHENGSLLAREGDRVVRAGSGPLVTGDRRHRRGEIRRFAFSVRARALSRRPPKGTPPCAEGGIRRQLRPVLPAADPDPDPEPCRRPRTSSCLRDTSTASDTPARGNSSPPRNALMKGKTPQYTSQGGRESHPGIPRRGAPPREQPPPVSLRR